MNGDELLIGEQCTTRFLVIFEDERSTIVDAFTPEHAVLIACQEMNESWFMTSCEVHLYDKSKLN